MRYLPDNWVILEFTQDDGEIFHKVLAGWSGGYLDGDHWRMNSGITKIVTNENYYDIHGHTGSIYTVRKESELVRMSMSGILRQLTDTGRAKQVDITDVLQEYNEDDN